MARAATEHAQVVIEAALSFLQGQLSIFAKLIGNRCRVSGGGLRFVGLLVFVKLVVLVAIVRFVAFFVGFVVRVVACTFVNNPLAEVDRPLCTVLRILLQCHCN